MSGHFVAAASDPRPQASQNAFLAYCLLPIAYCGSFTQ
jgi:hypothetical protein